MILIDVCVFELGKSGKVFFFTLVLSLSQFPIIFHVIHHPCQCHVQSSLGSKPLKREVLLPMSRCG